MCEMDRDETRRGDKLAFNTARESGDFFTIFVMFFFILFSDSNISFSTSHGIAWQGRPGQGRFQHVPAPRHTPPRRESDNDRASEGRGEAERVDIPQRNATHARILVAFSFLLGDGCTRAEDRIG
jgi:hypothetical protein